MCYPHYREKAGAVRLEKQGSQHFSLGGDAPHIDHLTYGAAARGVVNDEHRDLLTDLKKEVDRKERQKMC